MRSQSYESGHVPSNEGELILHFATAQLASRNVSAVMARTVAVCLYQAASITTCDGSELLGSTVVSFITWS